MKKIILTISVFMLGATSVAASVLPPNYKSLSACVKQNILWKQVEATEHKKLPELADFGPKQIFRIGVQALSIKKDRFSDEAPKKWEKHLHKRGAVAKVKFIPERNTTFTGLFKGSECGLLRLSVTYKPTEKRNFAPGLALKILRDKTYSANVSALYALEGQAKDYNFFKNPLSNIVPISDGSGIEGIGLKLIHSFFKRVTDYPEQLLMNDFAATGSNGVKVKKSVYPQQVFFKPNVKLRDKTSSDTHDFRKDILAVPSGTAIYEVYAVPEKLNINYLEYDLDMISKTADRSVKIGKLVTTSKFIASEFGDTGMFFRHQTRAVSNK